MRKVRRIMWIDVLCWLTCGLLALIFGAMLTVVIIVAVREWLNERRK